MVDSDEDVLIQLPGELYPRHCITLANFHRRAWPKNTTGFLIPYYSG